MWLQPFAKYLGLTLVLCEVTHYEKSLNSVIQELIAKHDRLFNLAGGLGTGLSFYRV